MSRTNRIISLILAAVMMFSVMPLTVGAETTLTAEEIAELTGDASSGALEDTPADSGAAVDAAADTATELWDYAEIDGGVELTKYNGSAADVYIPNKITAADGTELPVLKLANGLFENNDALNSATLGAGILEIGDRAFYDCDNLVCVLIAEETTTIGAEAFRGCDAFNSIILYDAVTSIGADAFADCPNVTVWCNEDSAGHTYAVENSLNYEILNPEATPETVVLNGITYYIQNGSAIAIDSEDTLTEAVIPATVNGYPVTELRETFKAHINITDVTLPEGLKVIGENVFDNALNLKKINIPSTVTTIGEQAFENCARLTEITLPDGLTEISNNAFGGCFGLATINLPDSLTEIGGYAFQNCTSLTNIVIPEKVTKIDAVFSGCTGLANVTIPESVEIIESSAFYDCTSLRNVIIPKSVTLMRVGSFPASTVLMVYENSYAHTFAKNRELLYVIYDGINVPEIIDLDGVTYYIQNDEAIAIDSDDALTEAVIPAAVNGYPVTELRETFRDNSNIVSVTLPEGLKVIGDYAFDTAINLTSVNIPSTVTTIGICAFYDCGSLSEIALPDGLTELENYAFAGCRELTEINFPDSLTEIGGHAFLNCNSLTSIVIPESVTVIDSGAFSGCTNLSSVTINSGDYIRIFDSAFYECTNLRTIILPQSVRHMTVTTFPESTILIVYENSYAHTFAENNDLFYVIYDGTDMFEIIDLDGITYYIQNSSAIAIDSDDALTEAVIPATVNGYPVTELRGTFRDNSNIVSVTLPEGLKIIGNNAFDTALNLTSVNIPSTVTTIGDYGFSTCVSITEVTLPDGLTEIGNYVFVGCRELTEINFPDSLTKIGTQAFSSCTSLASIAIPEGIKEIDTYVFVTCSNLADVIIPEGVATISSGAFSNCTSLRTVIIPKSVTSIRTDSFPTSTILMVYENSYAHTYAVENDLLYFILRETANPEIAYGTGITGTVTQSGGTAAAGAKVEILYDDGTVKETVTADANGAYAFTYAEVGRYTIRATDDTGNTATTQVSVKRLNVFDVYTVGDPDLVLKTGWTVSGTVADHTGAAADATVTLTDEDGSVITSVTAEGGAFTLNGIYNGTYILRAETADASAVQEITVFDGDVTGVVLTLPEAAKTSTIIGYVEVESRDRKHRDRRNWVNVTLYNSEGVVVGSCKSGENGQYSFKNLPIGEYTVVGSTDEQRPDKKHGYNRNHTLTGFAYVNITAAGTYYADTIVLKEEHESKITIAGKVTANGQSQTCEVTLRSIFGSEIASTTTKNNGKYSFTNVSDGAYVITAVTENDGMGFTVVTVWNGKVWGRTDIRVFKDGHIKDREDNFRDRDWDKDNIKDHRNEIADEKRWYDGLSEKERKQLSKEYVDKLNRYCGWITETDCTSDNENVALENGGEIISGKELEKGNSVILELEVEKIEGHKPNQNGVKDKKDQQYHDMQDAAGKNKGEIKEYYDVNLYKTVDGKTSQIESVSRDTDSKGKLRLVFTIPEEHRGRKHYYILHDHHGEIVTLADLDNDPNTITVEVDRFSTFALTATDESLVAEDSGDFLRFSGASLTLHNDLAVNYKVDIAELEEYGFTDPYATFTMGEETVTVTGYTEENGKYVFSFDGIGPQCMNDTIYATLHATLDGVEYSSAVTEYSIAKYAYNMLSKYGNDSAYAEFRTLLVDMLNYGAKSQEYAEYNTDALVNANLTEAQQSFATADDPALTDHRNMEHETVENPTAEWTGAGLNLKDSVTLRFKLETESIEGMSVRITSGDKSWTVAADKFAEADDGYYVYFNGLGVDQMRDLVYVTAYVGDTAVSNTMQYSIESYACSTSGKDDATVELKELVIAMMKYGDSAAAYAAN